MRSALPFGRRGFTVAVIVSSLAVTIGQAAELQLEGRESLLAKCRTTPGNTEAFCICLVKKAVAELPRDVRAELYVTWAHPTDLQFSSAKWPLTI